MTLMFHISPSRNRESIETCGLRPDPEAGGGMVWLFESPADAEPFLSKSWGGSLGLNDLWEVNIIDLCILPDPHAGLPGLTTWVALGRIRAERLRRVTRAELAAPAAPLAKMVA